MIIYSTDAEADRAFLADVLELPAVDVGGGWLLFALPGRGRRPPTDGDGSHELYFMCDDIEATKGELEAKGVAFDGDITNAGFGQVATLVLPGGGRVGVYQPVTRAPPR